VSRNFRRSVLFAPAPPKAGAAARPKESTWVGTAERGHQTARAGRDVAGIGVQLQRQPRHHFTIDSLILDHAANDRLR
jgi:hypothetical protein